PSRRPVPFPTRRSSDLMALDAFGRIDALINNAALFGGLKGGRFDAISEAEWDAAMAVNVKGIWNCCKAVVPAMRQFQIPLTFTRSEEHTSELQPRGHLV